MRFAALVAGVCLALAPGAGLRAESPLASLLDDVRAAGGMPYAYHLRAIVTQPVDGVREDYALDLDGARSFVRHCDGIACGGLYFDGKRNFATNLNDTALPTTPESPFGISLQAVLLEAFADPNFSAQGGAVALGAPLARDGTTYARLRVTAPLGSPIEVLIDPKTHLVAGFDDALHHVTFAYAPQRQLAVALPSEVAWTGANGRTQHFTDWTVVPEPLRPPAGLTPSLSSPVAVLKMLASDHGALPVVACTIGGQTVPALLDTGNSSLAMSLELAERLGIEPSGGAFSIRGVGQYATGVAQGPGFALGPVSFPAAKFTLLHDVHRYGYDIVLGADVFAHARITIDYARREVRFVQSASDRPETGAAPLEFKNFVPVANVQLGTTPAQLALDTGDESAVNLAGDFYEKNPALFAPTSTLDVGGIGGHSVEVLGTIASVRLAGFEVSHQRIGATRGLVATADGHLGSGFLAHFSVTFDYAAARLELVPRTGDAAVISVPSGSQ